MEDSEENTKTSKYNGAVAQIMRLDELWKDTHSNSRAGLFEKWNMDLDRVWCELSDDINKDDEKKLLEFNIKITNVKDNKSKLYPILLQKEFFLRKLQNKFGKGTKYDDDDGYMD